jgi:predicted nucleotidyltransferase
MGLEREVSDYDVRKVHIEPTRNFLLLDRAKPKGTQEIKGNKDGVSYEIGHFLTLALNSNPSILEVFVAPVLDEADIGRRLRDLLPYVWSTEGVLKAFCGYSHDQEKKMRSEKPENTKRRWKYALAHARVMMMAIDLLKTGTMSMKRPYKQLTDLMLIRDGEWTQGEVINYVGRLKEELEDEAYGMRPHKQDIPYVNNWLMNIRRDPDYWG